MHEAIESQVPQWPPAPPAPVKGRGAASNRESRYSRLRRESEPAGEADTVANGIAGGLARPTEIRIERARSIVSTNDSPDIPFDRSINPYRGCEHGCVYCYARPTHAYLGLSPGIDFETRIYAKTNAAELLRAEMARSRDRSLIALGANTDPYQPAEKRLKLTRSILEVACESGQRIAITTKSALVVRDIDLLRRLAGQGLVQVMISVGTLDPDIARTLEPRANSPQRRIEAIARLSEAGIPAGVIVAPVIPALTDQDLERVLEQASAAGARRAGYVLLRLPLEVSALFQEWLQAHYPLRAEHVMSLVRQSRQGRDNDPRFGIRMRGTGIFADLIARRFKVACKRLGLDPRDIPRLDAPAQDAQANPPVPAPTAVPAPAAPALPGPPSQGTQLPLFE